MSLSLKRWKSEDKKSCVFHICMFVVKTSSTHHTSEAFICLQWIRAPSNVWVTQSVAFTRLRAACIWFHREVVNMPVFSTSLLFWHAQLRQSSSKVSAWGCGLCRSAFTHTNLHFSAFSPQYGWMLLPVSPCWFTTLTLQHEWRITQLQYKVELFIY